MAHLRKRRRSPFWYVRFLDAGGKTQEVSTGTRSRRAAESIRAEWEIREAKIRAGLFDPEAERFAEERARPIGDHVEAYHRSLCARNPGRVEAKKGTKHASETRKLVELLLDRMGARTIDQLHPAAVMNAIASERRERDLSARWQNKALGALKSFCRFLVSDRRLERDPIQHLRQVNERVDRRRVRREPTDEQLVAVITAAAEGPVRGGLAGEDRAFLYRLAIATGLRAGELASLTRQSFDLAARTVTVEASYSKRRRRDTQDLPNGLCEDLRPWLERKMRRAPLFPVRRLSDKTAAIFRADLEAAGILYLDDAGEVLDFHALRHGFVSRVVRNVDAASAQAMSRHSTPELTLARYAHTRKIDREPALNAVDFAPTPAAPAEVVAKTGTEECPLKCPLESASLLPAVAEACTSTSEGNTPAAMRRKATSDGSQRGSGVSVASCYDPPDTTARVAERQTRRIQNPPDASGRRDRAQFCAWCGLDAPCSDPSTCTRRAPAPGGRLEPPSTSAEAPGPKRLAAPDSFVDEIRPALDDLGLEERAILASVLAQPRRLRHLALIRASLPIRPPDPPPPPPGRRLG